MTLQVIIQISHFDQKWGFDPGWVTEGSDPHLADLVDQIQRFSSECSFSLVTGNSNADHEIKNLFPDKIKTHSLARKDYEKEGALKAVREENKEWIFVVSGYTALLDIARYKTFCVELIEQNSAKKGLHFGTYIGRNYPPLIHRDIFGDILQILSEYNFQNPQIPNNPTWLTQNLPFWLSPGLLSVIGSNYYDFKVKLLPDVNSNIYQEQRFRPIISSQVEANQWQTIKNRHEKPFPYDKIRENYCDRLDQSLDEPLAIQVELSSSDRLYPANNLPKKNNGSLSTELLLEKIEETKKSQFYKTLIQVGVWHDPLKNEEFLRLIKNLDPELFQVETHTHPCSLPAYSTEELVENCQGIFLYLGGDEEEYEEYWTDGCSYEEALQATRKLIAARGEKAQQLFEDSRSTHIYPEVNLVYFKPLKLIEGSRWEEIQDFWLTKGKFTSRTEHPIPPKLNQFYESPSAIDHLVIKENKQTASAGEESSPLEPYERSVCRRMKESLTVYPEGTVMPCDQLADFEKFRLGELSETSLAECWNSSKRQEFIESQRAGNYEEFSSCQQWYQPTV